jgi:putative spermidine/putrescine transport system permease protein
MYKTQIFNRIGVPVFISIVLLPLAAGLGYALAYSFGLTGALSQGFTTKYWNIVLTNPETWQSLLLSASIALTVVLISTGLALGVLLYWGERLEQGLSGYLIYLPLAVPPLSAAFLGFQWLGKSGMLSRLGVACGLIPSLEQAPELINDPWHIGVVFVLSTMTMPYFLVLFLQYRRSENLSELTQLARTLGASSAQMIRRVAVPVLLRRAAPNLALSGIFLFGVYEVPLLLGRQSPRMISVMIAQKFKKFNLEDVPPAYALTVLYALIISLAAWWMYRQMRRVSGNEISISNTQKQVENL